MGYFDVSFLDQIFRQKQPNARGRCYGMAYQICYKPNDMVAFVEGEKRFLDEAPNILREWPYYMDRPDATRTDVENWLQENCNDEYQFPGLSFDGKNYEVYVLGILFKDEADAMAFKLAWS